MSVDALGNTFRFRLTDGQQHEITQAAGLVAELDFERLIADRSYVAKDFLQSILDAGAELLIPPRQNHKESREL